MQFHEVANIFPMMSAAEYEGLLGDIRQNGLVVPIETYQGKIIDGRNRYLACKELCIDPEYREWNGKGDLVSHVVSLNLTRRHLNESQRGMVAAKLANMKHGGDRRSNSIKESIDSLKQKDAAKLLSVSEPTVERANRVLIHGTPELVQAVENGEIKVSTAATLTKLPADQQNEVLEKGKESVLKATKSIQTKESKQRKKEEEKQIIPKPNEAILAKLKLADSIRKCVDENNVSVRSEELLNIMGITANQRHNAIYVAGIIEEFPDLISCTVVDAVQIATERRKQQKEEEFMEEIQGMTADDPRAIALEKLYMDFDKIFCQAEREGYDKWGDAWTAFWKRYGRPERTYEFITILRVFADKLEASLKAAIEKGAVPK